MTYFVGLDLGYGTTGLVMVAEDGEADVRVSITPPAGLSGVPRLEAIGDMVMAMVARRTDVPGAAIEGYSFGSKSQAHKIGELGGHIRTRLYHARVPTIIVPPNTLKKFATGNGQSPKAVMIREVYKRWAFETDCDDQADAVALAHMARYHFGPSRPDLRFQQEAMDQVQELALKPRERVRPPRTS